MTLVTESQGGSAWSHGMAAWWSASTSAPCPGAWSWCGSRTAPSSATATHDYQHGVLDQALPDGTPLGPDWALQVAADYVDVLKHAVPAALEAAWVDPADVIGIATDFTACTMVPTTADGTPLNEVDGFASGRTPTSSSGSTTPPSPRPTGSTPWRPSAERPGSGATAG